MFPVSIGRDPISFITFDLGWTKERKDRASPKNAISFLGPLLVQVIMTTDVLCSAVSLPLSLLLCTLYLHYRTSTSGKVEYYFCTSTLLLLYFYKYNMLRDPGSSLLAAWLLGCLVGCLLA